MLSEAGIQLWLYSGFRMRTKVWALTDSPLNIINETYTEKLTWSYGRYLATVNRITFQTSSTSIQLLVHRELLPQGTPPVHQEGINPLQIL